MQKLIALTVATFSGNPAITLRAVTMQAAIILFVLVVRPISVTAQIPVDTGSDQAWTKAAGQAVQLLHNSMFADAAVAARRALVAAKAFTAPDERLAGTYFLLASISREWEHCADARTNYARAIAVWEKLPDPNPRYLFNAILALINTDIECGDYDAVQKAYHVHGAELQRYSSGPVDEAKLLAARGAVEREHKNYRQAETFLRQALDAFEHAPSEPPTERAELHINLAVVLGDQGRKLESLDEAQRAITIFEASGKRRPEMLAALNVAATSMGDLGRKDEAEQLFQRALRGAAELFGEENRLTATIMLNYAKLLRNNKQSRTAAEMQRKGLEAWRQSHTENNSTVDVNDLRR
jgi:tetratricopeptide (TPR) repeat protein